MDNVSSVALELESINWGVNETLIIKNIDITVLQNEFVGILGPNGSGKSSLLRCMFRYLKPQSGRVKINGDDINIFSMKQTAKMIAAVLQERNTEFSITVLDFVLLGRAPHNSFWEMGSKNDMQLARESISKVNMASFSERTIASLSGGELQRVLIARALCQNADILILDEPTNHLDIRYQMEVMSLIKKLRFTTVAALHEINLASMFCDRIFLLANGEIVASGTPSEVLTEERLFKVYGIKTKIHNVGQSKKMYIQIIPPDML